MPFLLRS